MQHKKIIFVCTGNTCRSPMAEAAFKAELKKRKIRWYNVRSAGLHAEVGAPMSENSARVLTEAGIPFSREFKARAFTEKMLEESYAVVCMTESQRLYFRRRNVTSFYELTGRDIPDPYGQDVAVYRATLAAILQCIPRIVEALCKEDTQQ